MPSSGNLSQNKTINLFCGTAAETKTLTFDVRNYTSASFHIKVCDATPCAAITFADPDVCVGNDSIISTNHGLFTGLKGLLTQACDPNSVFVDECVCLTCDTITETGHALCTGQVGAFTIAIGCAVACISSITDVNVCCNQFTATAHGLTEGERGQVTTTCTLPTGLAVCTNYYVIKVSCCIFQLAASRANAIAACPTPICITGTGTGCMTFTPNGAAPTGLTVCTCYYVIKVDANTYKLATTNANALAGTAIDITALNSPASMTFNPGGTLPTGLCACTTYYVIRVDANTFKLATSLANASAGTAVILDGTNGAATISFTACTNVTGSIAFTGSVDGEIYATIPCGPAATTLNCVECTAICKIDNTWASGGLGGIRYIRLTLTITEGQVTTKLVGSANS